MDGRSSEVGEHSDPSRSRTLPALRSDNTKPSPPSDTLDLSKKKLSHLPEDLYRYNPCVKNLHLEGNVLRSIPENLFLYLPNLVWLDLRYNDITSLPATIGKHRLLTYLLLEGNPITALPVELGDLTTLKALNLRHCPLEFPPADVVCKGLEVILSFLRNARHEADCEGLEANEAESPPMEKLDLNALMTSSLDLTEEEGRTFQMLKSKMEAQEMEEKAHDETLYFQKNIPKMSKSAKNHDWKFLTQSREVPVLERRKAEADKHAEEKDLLALALQKQRKQELLKEWQKQTKRIQEQTLKNRNEKQSQHKVPMAIPPFATDLDPSQTNNNWEKQMLLGAETQEKMPRIMSVKSLKEMEKERASRDLRLENRIKQHIQTMQERKRNPKRSAQEEMEAARQELEMAAVLQAELLQRKREQDLPLEYRFTAFTGDITPSTPPRARPQYLSTTT